MQKLEAHRDQMPLEKDRGDHVQRLHLSGLVYCQSPKAPLVQGGARAQSKCGEAKGSSEQGPQAQKGLRTRTRRLFELHRVQVSLMHGGKLQEGLVLYKLS